MEKIIKGSEYMETAITNISIDGFEGVLYPVSDRKDKIIIVISGSNGGLKMTKQCAEFYARNGIPSLAVALFNTKETPRHLSCIPIEYIEKAVLYLKKKGYENIGIDGMSKGSELALLSATMFKDLTCVIARVPSYFVSEGLVNKNPSGTSCWSYHNKGIPFTKYRNRKFNILKDIIKEKAYNLLDTNRNKDIIDESIIPVEKINGSILLVSSINDSVWSSFESGKYIERRLNENRFPFPHKHIAFQHIGHLMTTEINANMQLLFKSERNSKNQCKLEREKLKEELLNWVENEWCYQRGENSKESETLGNANEQNENRNQIVEERVLRKENDNSIEI